MKVIKEYCPAARRCVIRMNTYGSSKAFFDNLFGIAKEDFPALKDSEIEVVQFGGIRYKRTFGIEFSVVAEVPVPDEYQEIRELEYKL